MMTCAVNIDIVSNKFEIFIPINAATSLLDLHSILTSFNLTNTVEKKTHIEMLILTNTVKPHLVIHLILTFEFN